MKIFTFHRQTEKRTHFMYIYSLVFAYAFFSTCEAYQVQVACPPTQAAAPAIIYNVSPGCNAPHACPHVQATSTATHATACPHCLSNPLLLLERKHALIESRYKLLLWLMSVGLWPWATSILPNGRHGGRDVLVVIGSCLSIGMTARSLYAYIKNWIKLKAIEPDFTDGAHPS